MCVCVCDVFPSQGSTFPFSPCGHAFMPHPDWSRTQSPSPNGEESGIAQTELKTNIDHLLEVLTQLAPRPPPGVWVCSTDMLLTVPPQLGECLLIQLLVHECIIRVSSTFEWVDIHFHLA